MLETGNLCCVWHVGYSSKVDREVTRKGLADVTILGIL